MNEADAQLGLCVYELSVVSPAGVSQYTYGDWHLVSETMFCLFPFLHTVFADGRHSIEKVTDRTEMAVNLIENEE